MSGLGPLPEPVASVEIPRTFAASSLWRLQECALSVLHGLPAQEQLPSHPHAILGTILHRVAEKCPGDPGSFDTLLRHEVESIESELSADPATRGLVPLERAVGGLEWRSRIARSRKRMIASRGSSDRSSPSASSAGARDSHDSDKVIGTEIYRSDDSLRLTGRMDAVSERDGKIVITEWKTGSIRDRATGELLPAHGLQLAAYVRLLEAARPGQTVLTRIGTSRPKPLPTRHFDQLEEVMQDASDRMPAGQVVAASSLANPGSACRLCSIRHRCSIYLDAAPSRGWSGLGDVRPPLDTWGTLVRLHSCASSTAIRLEDAAGRRVSVTGLEDRWGLSRADPGDFVWCFQLETGERPERGRGKHPVNLHQFTTLPGLAQAHRAVVYWSAAE